LFWYLSWSVSRPRLRYNFFQQEFLTKRIKTHFFVLVAFVAVASLFTVCDDGGYSEEYDQNNNTTIREDYVETPVAQPGAGAVPSGMEITLVTGTERAAIYYTIDGDTPTTDSLRYSDGKPMITQPATLRAIAERNGITSDVLEVEYTLQPVETPVARPGAGAVLPGTEITLETATDGAAIYYTIDGDPPTTGSSRYSDGKPKITQPAILRAIAELDGVTSEVLEVGYTLLPAGTELTVDLGSGNTFIMDYVPPMEDTGFQYRDGAGNTATITNGYWVGKTEVTQELFYAVMGVNPSGFYDNPYSDDTGTDDQAQRPVDQVSWYAAIAFCNKLSALDGKTPVYSIPGIDEEDWATFEYNSIPYIATPPVPSYGWRDYHDADWDAATFSDTADGYRLPTEMEWVWAGMGGTLGNTIALGSVYTNGYKKKYAGSLEDASHAVDAGDYAWYNAWGWGITHQVSKKDANELGLYDMSGNVEEWCWDWFDSSTSGTKSDYKGPNPTANLTNHVTRGGSYQSISVIGLGWDQRGSDFPASRNKYTGFRVVQKQ
jgi:formylglycine-generating enzyme required for sulfatase activity